MITTSTSRELMLIELAIKKSLLLILSSFQGNQTNKEGLDRMQQMIYKLHCWVERQPYREQSFQANLIALEKLFQTDPAFIMPSPFSRIWWSAHLLISSILRLSKNGPNKVVVGLSEERFSPIQISSIALILASIVRRPFTASDFTLFTSQLDQQLGPHTHPL